MWLSCSSDTYSDGRVRLLCGFSSNCKRPDNTLHVHCQYPSWRTFKVTFHSLSYYQICHNEYSTFTKVTKLHLLGWKFNVSWLENKAHSKILNDVKCNLFWFWQTVVSTYYSGMPENKWAYLANSLMYWYCVWWFYFYYNVHAFIRCY